MRTDYFRGGFVKAVGCKAKKIKNNITTPYNKFQLYVDQLGELVSTLIMFRTSFSNKVFMSLSSERQ